MSTDHSRAYRDGILIEKQYDKIYRYCYFKLHNRELAEDITQETFLKYLERYRFSSPETALKYLYTIARHLCIDQYRRHAVLPLKETAEYHAASSPNRKNGSSLSGQISAPSGEDALLTAIAVRSALGEMTPEEQELLLLRYVNEVPVGVIAKLFGISRFALRRKLLAASETLKNKLGEEDFL